MKPSHSLPLSSLAIFIVLAVGNADAADGFECRWAASPPKIDGKLDDAVWKNSQMVDAFQSAWLPVDQRKPPTSTKARLLWDREYLYFSAEMEDWDVFANVTEQDVAIWTCDVFELFFKPAEDKTGYYEFEVNAANGKLDMFLPSRGAGGYNRHAKERDFHIDSSVEVRGTINNWSDKDKGWTVEGRIPWRDFLPTGGRPAPGEVWQHSLCRYDYSAGLENHSLSTNTPVASAAKADFHRYEDYVPLKFIGPHDGAAIKRAPATSAWLAGSPEPPLPYHAVPAFSQLKTAFPIMIKPEPGRDGFILLESNGYVPVRKARVLRVTSDSQEPEELLALNESLYDVCFHPQFARNGFIYLGANGRFGAGKDDFNTRVLRYMMDRKTGLIDPASRTTIIEWWSHGHNGASLTFGKDGMLYVTSGDGGNNSDEWSSGQDLTRLLAKLLRIDVDHPAGGKAYSIPKDNPFLDIKDARPETWAYGFRNPWRMTIDRETGDLWVGENGQDLWEYARIAKRGENYGWPVIEGTHDFHQTRKQGPTPITKALVEHSHTDFRSLTGGIVYRGSKFKDLAGCYIYGDYSTGQIWAAKQEHGKLISDRCIADSALAIAAFCETPQGDILVVDYTGNAVHQLERHIITTTATAKPFPAKLSDTGLFTNAAASKPHPALIRYEVNAPGWHDGANSERYIALPDDGRMEFTEQGGWNLPDGSAIVQTLSLAKQRIETRVLVRQQGEWTGYSYAWNDAETDAKLAPAAGETRKDWRIPSRQECSLCHSRQANFVLGLSTVQLNRDDQIARWEREGLLRFNHAIVEEAHWRAEITKDKPADDVLQVRLDLVLPTKLQREPAKDSALLPQPPNSLPKLARPSAATASLEARARAYLHANCAHCHMRNGGGNSAMQLASHIEDTETINATPMHEAFGIPDAKLIAPGAPERSLLVYRPAVRGPGQMPPIGTMKPDGEGIALLSKWIGGMKGSSTSTSSGPP